MLVVVLRPCMLFHEATGFDQSVTRIPVKRANRFSPCLIRCKRNVKVIINLPVENHKR